MAGGIKEGQFSESIELGNDRANLILGNLGGPAIPAETADYLDTPAGAAGQVGITADTSGAVGNSISLTGENLPIISTEEAHYNASSTEDVPIKVDGTRAVGMVVQAPGNFSLSRVDARIRKFAGQPGNNVTLLIRNAEQSGSFRPIGAVIATAVETIDSSTIGEVFTFQTFTFSSPVPIISGTYYSIELWGDGPLNQGSEVSLSTVNTASTTNGVSFHVPGGDPTLTSNWSFFNLWHPKLKIYSAGTIESKDVDTLMGEWNVANPLNTATVNSGGAETPSDGAVLALTGGVNATGGEVAANLDVSPQADLSLNLGAETFKWKNVFKGVDVFKEQAVTPLDPSAGDFKLYFRAGELFKLDSAGVESAVGGAVDLSAIDQPVLPSTNNTYAIGTDSLRWFESYITTMTGTTVNASDFNIDNGTGAEANLEVSSNSFNVIAETPNDLNLSTRFQFGAATKDVTLSSGDSITGTSNSGSVTVKAGAAGGTRGDLNFDGNKINFTGSLVPTGNNTFDIGNGSLNINNVFSKQFIIQDGTTFGGKLSHSTSPTDASMYNSNNAQDLRINAGQNAGSISAGADVLISGDTIDLHSNSVSIDSKIEVNSTTLASTPSPVMTRAQMEAIVAPTEGSSVYNSTDEAVYNYNASLGEWLIAGAVANIENISDWKPYIPTTITGLGVTTNNALEWRRIGSEMEVRGSFTNGSVSAVRVDIELPNSETIGGTSTVVVASGTMTKGVTATTADYMVIATKGNTYVNLSANNSGVGVFTGGTIQGTLFNTGENLSFKFSVPIEGWTSLSKFGVSTGDYVGAHIAGSAQWATGGGSWITSADAWSDFPANASAPVPTVTGTVTVPNNQLLAIKIPSAKKGTYRIEVQGHFASAQQNDSSFRLFNGTSSLGVMAVEHSTQNSTHLTGSTAHISGDLDIKIQAADHGHTGGDNSSININTYQRDLTITVYYFPDSDTAADDTRFIEVNNKGSELVYYDGLTSLAVGNMTYRNAKVDDSDELLDVTHSGYTRYTFKKKANFVANTGLQATTGSVILYHYDINNIEKGRSQFYEDIVKTTTMVGQAEVGDYLFVYSQTGAQSDTTKEFFSVLATSTEVKAYIGNVNLNSQWQEKSLASLFTGTGIITGLTFNNLTIGETYRYTFNLLENSSGVAGANGEVKNGATTIFRFSDQGAQSNLSYPGSITFTATATTVTIEMTNNPRGIGGDGTTGLTFAQLEELKHHKEVGIW